MQQMQQENVIEVDVFIGVDVAKTDHLRLRYHFRR